MKKSDFQKMLDSIPDDAELQIYHVIGKDDAMHDEIGNLLSGFGIFTIYPLEYSRLTPVAVDATLPRAGGDETRSNERAGEGDCAAIAAPLNPNG